MTKFFAVIAFAIALPMSNPAHAYIKCDKKEDAHVGVFCVVLSPATLIALSVKPSTESLAFPTWETLLSLNRQCQGISFIIYSYYQQLDVQWRAS